MNISDKKRGDPVSHYDFTADNNVPFRAVFEPEEREDAPLYAKAGKVAFYDRRHQFTPNGQFTGARYYVSDLLNPDDLHKEYGLNLYGGVHDWSLDPQTLAGVLAWLESVAPTSHLYGGTE